MNDSLPLVTVRCTTYNHAPYIRDCLEGFVRQQTNFKFECIVYDDASTDGTSDVVREYAEKYPDIIKPFIQEKNLYSSDKRQRHQIIKSNTRGKYTAFCEGDDYWIDPLKLQKQVDFLDSNPDYGLCHTRKISLFVETGEKVLSPSFVGIEENVDNYLRIYHISIVTALWRTDLHNEYLEDVDPVSQGWLGGDYPFFIWMLIHSKSKSFEEPTAMYRVLPESACHSRNLAKLMRFRLSTDRVTDYYIRRFKLNFNIDRFHRDSYLAKFELSIKAKDRAAFCVIFSSLWKHERYLLKTRLFWSDLWKKLPHFVACAFSPNSK